MDQLRALLWLRWLEFKYRFRRKEGLWSSVSVFLFASFLAPASITLGFLAVIQAALFSGNSGSGPSALAWIHLLLGINFLGYQMTNLFDPQRCEGFDLRRLQPFPIPLSRLYRLNLLASMNDAVFLFFVPMQLGLMIGFFWGQGAGGIGWLPVLLLFNFLNLALSSLIGLWIGQLTQVRWRKELLILFLPVLALLVYWLPFWWAENQKGGHGSLLFIALQIKTIGIYIPSGWAVRAMEKQSAGQIPWLETLLLLSTGWIGYRLGLRSVRNTLMNRESSNRIRDSLFSQTSSTGVSWSQKLGLSSELSALFEKELKYLLRSNQGRYAFVWPVILVLLFRIFSGQSEGNRYVFDLFRQYRLLPFVIFLFLFFLPFYVGLFAFDHRGVRLYFFAPISLKNVLLAKNLAILSLAILCFSEILLLYLIVFRDIDGIPLIQTIVGLPLGFLLLFIGGNILSCYFPKSLKMGALRGNNPPRAAAFLGMLLTAMASVLVGLSIIGGSLAGPIPGLGLELGALMLMGFLYRMTLNPVARLYQKRRELLIEALADQEVKE